MIFYLLLRFLRILKPARKQKRTICIEFGRRAKPKPTRRVQAQPIQRPPARLEKERARAERAERMEAKRAAQIEQAELDAPFYESQLDDYTRLHRDAHRLYEAAQLEVDKDDELNKYGAVVSIKTYAKHVAMRDRYKKAVLMYERQIHAAQKNLDKAKRTLNQTGG